MPAQADRKALAHSERPLPSGARFLGELRLDERLSVTFVLRTRPDGQPVPGLDHWGRTPPGQRRYLTVDEFAAVHGADPADIAAVESFAAAHGMTVEASNTAAGTVTVSGTAAQMNEAFGITLNRYESPLHVGRDRHRPAGSAQWRTQSVQQHRGFEGRVHLPAGLNGVVTAVFGLDNRILGGINGASGDPPGAVQLTVPQIAQRYNFPTSGAAGQTIGIFNGGGNYDPADISAYIASLPAGYKTAPTVVEVDLTVDGTTFSNDKTKVQNPSNPDFEITQDIETSATVAQGATIAVYCSVSTEDGWLAFLQSALFPAAGAPAPSVLSSSWFISARDDAATVGQGVLDTLSAFFAKAAPLGISIFIAVGDSGSDSGVPGGKCRVQYPGSDPWVTSVGGTVLGSSAEWVWSEEPGNGATDGGVSDYFPVPAYQTDAGVNPTSLNDNKVRRGVPDIAGNSGAASAYTGLRLGGNGFSYFGTSCAAPLYAGLAAALNAALAEPIGFLNPTLYGLGTSVTNDVTTGNNDPADGSGAKFYTAGTGWDACTGWGSLQGNELLQAFQALFKKQVSFLIEQVTFSRDEVDLQLPGVATFAAGWIAVDGFRPSELGLNPGNLGSPPASSIPDITFSPDPSLPPAVASAIQGMLKKPSFAGPVVPVDPSLPNEPQRFLFPFVIQFTSDAGFLAMASAVPALTTALVTLSGSLTVAGSTFQAAAEAELTTGENPRFEHVDPQHPAAFPTWESFDLRLFKMTVPPNGHASRFGATVTGPADAPAFIAAAAANLTNDNGNVGGDTFDNGLSQDEDSSKIEFKQQDNNGNFVYNFALARVRITAKSAATARTVRVFFRLFQAQNTVSDFNENTTYRFASDGVTFGHKIPRLGVQNDQHGNPEYVTIPCFATPRIVLTDRTKSMDDQDDPPNARDLATSPGGEKDYYFGCWIDNNQPQQLIMPASPPPGKFDGPWPNNIQLSPMRDAMTAFPHQCLIAEIRYDDTPVPAGANTTTSDKLTQRNIAWLDGPNPGLDVSRRMVHPVQVRPTPKAAANPDELMIFWGRTPPGSAAQLYLPALAAADILRLADERYPGHLLRLVDSHTVGCPAEGVTFVPMPNGTALAAGLLSIDLSAGVRRGDAYTVSVRQITDASAAVSPPPPPPPPPRIAGSPAVHEAGSPAVHEAGALAVHEAGPLAVHRKRIAWRQVSGGFQFVLTISTKQQLLLSEERLLAVLRWMLQVTPPSKRWYPVLRRYVADVEGRVLGFGGNPGSISPSPTGDVPGLHHRPRHEEHKEITGKISGIVYDHFGDFDGFIVETEDGCHRRFRSRETPVLRLVRRAWLDRARVTIAPERERPEVPRELILRTRDEIGARRHRSPRDS